MKSLAAKLFWTAVTLVLLWLTTFASSEVVGLYIFVAGFTAIGMYLAGFRRVHAQAARRREAARFPDRPSAIGGPRTWIAPRVFRAKRPVLAATSIALMGLGMLAGAAAVMALIEGSVGDRFAIAFPLFAGGLFFPWYAWRHCTLFVRVTEDGLECQGYFRRVRMAWDDMVALVGQEFRHPSGYSLGRLYSVYSRNDKLVFSGGVECEADLVPLVSEATELAWE